MHQEKLMTFGAMLKLQLKIPKKIKTIQYVPLLMMMKNMLLNGTII